MDALPAHMRPERSFQGFILALQRFWAEQGCVILQPYDMEMGAGTFHPATTLRALGPKLWNAAYVQPSPRPKDGRYGENPNRFQHYYQFQVILKPSPDDMQDLYLQSLARIGLDDAEQHSQGGGLAGAVGAEDAVDRPFGHREIDPVDRERAVEALDQAARFDRELAREIVADHRFA